MFCFFVSVVRLCTHPKQEAEEEEKVSDPGVDEGERLRSVQIQFPVHLSSFFDGPTGGSRESWTSKQPSDSAPPHGYHQSPREPVWWWRWGGGSVAACACVWPAIKRGPRRGGDTDPPYWWGPEVSLCACRFTLHKQYLWLTAAEWPVSFGVSSARV